MDRVSLSSAQFADTFKDIINDGGLVPVVVTGNSMFPFLVHGKDTVWLSVCKKEDLKKGRILLFQRDDGTLVLHRVKKVLSENRLEINGDAQYWCEVIRNEQVIAVVTYIEKNNKKVSCDSLSYKIKVWLWQDLKPVRPVIFKIRRKISKKAVNRKGERK